MSLFSAEDNAAMLDPFSQEMVGKHGSLDSFIFNAIFNNKPKHYGEDVFLSGSNPNVIATVAEDTSSLEQDDTISISSVVYKIRDIDINQGLITFELSK
jgi:hypothetical protein